MTEETVLVIESAGYFGKIGALLELVPKRVLANYLVLRHVLDLSGATTETMPNSPWHKKLGFSNTHCSL